MVRKFINLFCLSSCFFVFSQEMTEQISIFTKQPNRIGNKQVHYAYTGSEYIVYSNYNSDSAAFDFIFKIDTNALKKQQKILVELLDGLNVVYSKETTVDFYKNIYMTNFNDCSNCYVIRIRLPKPSYGMLYLDANDEKRYKLKITRITPKKIICDDLYFKFAVKPEN